MFGFRIVSLSFSFLFLWVHWYTSKSFPTPLGTLLHIQIFFYTPGYTATPLNRFLHPWVHWYTSKSFSTPLGTLLHLQIVFYTPGYTATPQIIFYTPGNTATPPNRFLHPWVHWYTSISFPTPLGTLIHLHTVSYSPGYTGTPPCLGTPLGPHTPPYHFLHQWTTSVSMKLELSVYSER